MNHTHSTSKTKRGNTYNTRSTKLANGYSQVLADGKETIKNLSKYTDKLCECEREKLFNEASKKYSERRIKENDLLRLAVKGTTDELNGIKYLVKTITIEHPVDKGYFKKVLVLNETGRTIVQRKKKRLEREKKIQ